MPTQITTPTLLEQSSGNVITETALTVVAALAGGPLAPLLPVLAKSLASERQRKRVETTLLEITSVLDKHEQALQNLSDAQYKLFNETLLTVLHTTSEEKLSFLRRVICNGLLMPNIQPSEASVLSRVVRDISAEEVVFLFQNFSHERIQFGTTSGPEREGILVVPTEGQNEIVISGLISLGLLIPAGPAIDDMGVMRFSDCVEKLLALLKQPD